MMKSTDESYRTISTFSQFFSRLLLIGIDPLFEFVGRPLCKVSFAGKNDAKNDILPQHNPHRPEKAPGLDPGRFLPEGLVLGHQSVIFGPAIVDWGVASLHFRIPCMLEFLPCKDKYMTGKGLFQRLLCLHACVCPLTVGFMRFPLLFNTLVQNRYGLTRSSISVIHCGINKKQTGVCMKSVLFFDKMLTPKIITIVYWLLLLAAIVGGIGSMFSGFQGFGIKSFIMGIVYAVGGMIGARIWCELLIVLFKMNEALQDLRSK